MSLMPGAILDTPEKLAEAGSKAATCQVCNQQYFKQNVAETCWGCHYDDAMDQANVRFGALAEALEQLLEVKTSVDQTGGMVMCLRVPIGKQTEDSGKYAWFSELSEHEFLGVGLYHSWDDEGTYHTFPLEGREKELHWPCGDGRASCAWYHHPVLATAVAEWAAPLILAFATEDTPC